MNMRGYYATKEDHAIDMLLSDRQDGSEPTGSGYRLSQALLTRDQALAIARWMGAEQGEEPDNVLSAAIDDRNLARHVTLAAERVIAFMAPHLEPDEDPVDVVRLLMTGAGWDV